MPMTVEALLITLLVGAIAGWLAGQIVSGYGFGLLGNIIVGILGAFVASFLFHERGLLGNPLIELDHLGDARCRHFVVPHRPHPTSHLVGHELSQIEPPVCVMQVGGFLMPRKGANPGRPLYFELTRPCAAAFFSCIIPSRAWMAATSFTR